MLTLVGLAVLSYRLPIFSPDLYAPNSIYRFGAVTEGDTVQAQFTVRNLHLWSVTLTGLRGSCGCTAPLADRSLPARIAPFESVTVRAAVDTSGRPGPLRQTVHVITNENKTGTPLLIEGEVHASKGKQ